MKTKVPLTIEQVTLQNTLKNSNLGAIASIVRRDWKNVYFGAVPYLGAMRGMNTIDDNYGADSGRSIVLYFLSNAATWRGPVAKLVKSELKSRLKK